MTIRRTLASAAFCLPVIGREVVFRAVSARDIANVRRRSEEFGIRRRADWQQLAPSLATDTAFLLGGGSSIQGLSSDHFEQIKHGISMAHEWWPRHHTFVPTAIWVETTAELTWRHVARLANDEGLRHVFVTRILPSKRHHQSAHIVPSESRKMVVGIVRAPIPRKRPASSFTGSNRDR